MYLIQIYLTIYLYISINFKKFNELNDIYDNNFNRLYNSHTDELRMDPKANFANISRYINDISKVIFDFTHERAFSTKGSYNISQEYVCYILNKHFLFF